MKEVTAGVTERSTTGAEPGNVSHNDVFRLEMSEEVFLVEREVIDARYARMWIDDMEEYCWISEQRTQTCGYPSTREDDTARIRKLFEIRSTCRELASPN
jgi:hypothetical protein